MGVKILEGVFLLGMVVLFCGICLNLLGVMFAPPVMFMGFVVSGAMILAIIIHDWWRSS